MDAVREGLHEGAARLCSAHESARPHHIGSGKGEDAVKQPSQIAKGDAEISANTQALITPKS